jgi:rhamnosyltransferase
MRVSLCIPTLNAASVWRELSSGISKQTQSIDCVLVIDSESADETDDLAIGDGFRVVTIARKEFRHGSTRQQGVEFLDDSDVIVFLTQDAVLASSGAVAQLVSRFSDPKVGAVYGRQLPRKEAGLIEAHARTFNYPSESAVRTRESVATLGLRAIFFSNSFSAYRRVALQSIGGFARDVTFGEDTIVAAQLLLGGWTIAYAADAEVFHSHGYTIAEEYKRYEEIGNLHASHPWLRDNFGHAGGEGVRFVQSQITMLLRQAPWLVPAALLRIGCKFIGYRTGLMRGAKAMPSNHFVDAE